METKSPENVQNIQTIADLVASFRARGSEPALVSSGYVFSFEKIGEICRHIRVGMLVELMYHLSPTSGHERISCGSNKPVSSQTNVTPREKSRFGFKVCCH